MFHYTIPKSDSLLPLSTFRVRDKISVLRNEPVGTRRTVFARDMRDRNTGDTVSVLDLGPLRVIMEGNEGPYYLGF